MKVETDVDVMGNKFTLLQIMNGNKGWTKLGEKVVDMDKDQLAELVQHFHAHRVANLAALSDKAFKLSLMGESKVNGRGRGRRPGVSQGPPRRDLFFDKETGLIVKTERRSRDIFGNDRGVHRTRRSMPSTRTSTASTATRSRPSSATARISANWK